MVHHENFTNVLICLKDSFTSTETYKSAGGSALMYIASLFTGDQYLKLCCTYGAMILGLITACIGVLRAIEMYRIEKLKRIKLEKEITEDDTEQ